MCKKPVNEGLNRFTVRLGSVWALCLWSCWHSETLCLSFHVPPISVFPPFLCHLCAFLFPRRRHKLRHLNYLGFPEKTKPTNYQLDVRVSFIGNLSHVSVPPLRLLTSCLLPCFHIAGCIFSVPEDTNYIERRVARHYVSKLLFII